MSCTIEPLGQCDPLPKRSGIEHYVDMDTADRILIKCKFPGGQVSETYVWIDNLSMATDSHGRRYFESHIHQKSKHKEENGDY
jgi:hypothetical protein